jgi:phosphoadenosine phosphosulfate reductase
MLLGDGQAKGPVPRCFVDPPEVALWYCHSMRLHLRGAFVADPVAVACETIDAARAEFGQSLAVLTSFQREGVVILDLVMQAAPRTPVVTIDTGRLPEATFQMIDEVERRYGIKVERILPDAEEVSSMVERHGRDLFREAVAMRMLCCNVRKVRPLARRMLGVGAFFNGMRRARSLQPRRFAS